MRRPWLIAKRINISLTWSAIVHRELLFDAVEMSDWRMVVETFANGTHNWPRLNGPTAPASGRPAAGGGDHAVRARQPWGVRARRPRRKMGRDRAAISTSRSSKLGDYRGRAEFSEGTIRLRQLRADVGRSQHQLRSSQDGKIMLERIRSRSPMAPSRSITGVVDSARWPEMFYQVKSQGALSAHARDLFRHATPSPCTAKATSPAPFTSSRAAASSTAISSAVKLGLNAYRFQNLEGSLIWLPERFEVTRATSAFFGGRTRVHATSWRRLATRMRKARGRFEVDYENVDLEALTRLPRSCRAFASPDARPVAICWIGRSALRRSNR